MTYDPADLAKRAQANEDEDFRFRRFLKDHPSLSSTDIDGLVFGIAEKVWKGIDCTACGNCCRVMVAGFSEADVDRLAKHLGMDRAEFISKYLELTDPGEDVPWVMRARPCPFLEANRCSVYEHRPGSCRNYPYLHKSDFIRRTLAMMTRTGQCPAVFEVWKELKQATGFRPFKRRQPR